MIKLLTSKYEFNVLSIIVTSGIISSLVSVWMTDLSNVRLENSRAQYEQRVKIIETFDSAEATLLLRTTVNMALFSEQKSDPSRKADVMQALVGAQLAANDVSELLMPEDNIY